MIFRNFMFSSYLLLFLNFGCSAQQKKTSYYYCPLHSIRLGYHRSQSGLCYL